MPFRSFVALFLSTLLAAQQDAPVSKLNLIVIEGDGAINNVKQRVTREPIVQVEDENRKPVAGAIVAFTLPSQGASGTFTNGARILTVTTDQNGRAVMSGMRANNVPGKMEIRVNASHRGQTATTTLTATNIAAAGAAIATGTLVTILAVVGGAAAAGIAVAATRGNGGSTTPASTPTVVSPGSPSVGPPR
ncbi:MAG: hypothetical protein JNK87_38405 [Bryobacterales bacterium]|nr:hypothetical protein [Bryobacterales bacterium]